MWLSVMIMITMVVFVSTRFSDAFEASTVNRQFRHVLYETVKRRLGTAVLGQDRATNRIIGAFNRWNFMSANSVDSEDELSPLVLSFIGTTGIGKTKSGNVIIAAAEDIAKDPSMKIGTLQQIGYDKNLLDEVSVINELLATILFQLIDNEGRVVIQIDEIHSMPDAVIKSLLPLIDGSFAKLDPSAEVKKILKKEHGITVPLGAQFSTRNCVFIFTTDLGDDQDLMHKMVVEKDSREEAERDVEFQRTLRSLLDRNGQSLNKLVTSLVPFFPLEQPQIKDIANKKLAEFIAKHEYKPAIVVKGFLWNFTAQEASGLWSSVLMDDKVIDCLVDENHVKYESPEGFESFNFSKFGARELMNAGPLTDLMGALLTEAMSWKDKGAALTVSLQQRCLINEPVKVLFEWCDSTAGVCERSVVDL